MSTFKIASGSKINFESAMDILSIDGYVPSGTMNTTIYITEFNGINQQNYFYSQLMVL